MWRFTLMRRLILSLGFGNLFFILVSLSFILYGIHNTACPPTAPLPLRSRERGGNVTATFVSRGLGNVLFQYASLYGLARHGGKTVVLPPRMGVWKFFTHLNARAARSDDLVDRTWVQVLEHKASAYDSLLADTVVASAANINVVGYLQSWLYFRDVADDVRRQFRFTQQIRDRVDMALLAGGARPAKPEVTTVGIHVRRGDLADEQFREYGYNMADADFLHRAMEHMESKYKQVQYVVCSDEITWCRNNIKSQRRIMFSENQTAIVDLALLASCDHVIMTVGTFGWWGGWLAGGDVIYYKDFPLEDSRLRLSFSRSKSDYYMDHWIPM